MRHKSDFPALSDSVARIQQVANSENKNVSALSGEILKDVALTNKLLRLVNTAQLHDFGRRHQHGLARGRDGRLQQRAQHGAQPRAARAHARQGPCRAAASEEFLRSLLAGMLASELGTTVPGSEEAYLGALFQNLGRLLTAFYFPDEARQVRGIVSGGGTPGESRVSEATASMRVLGISFETLGLGVAKSLGPARRRSRPACARRPASRRRGRRPTATERLRWLTYTANRVADTLLQAEPEHAASEVAAVAKRYARSIGVTPEQIEAASAAARAKLAQAVDAMSLQVPRQSPRAACSRSRRRPRPSSTSTCRRCVEDATHVARTMPLGDATVAGARDAVGPC